MAVNSSKKVALTVCHASHSQQVCVRVCVRLNECMPAFLFIAVAYEASSWVFLFLIVIADGELLTRAYVPQSEECHLRESLTSAHAARVHLQLRQVRRTGVIDGASDIAALDRIDAEVRLLKAEYIVHSSLIVLDESIGGDIRWDDLPYILTYECAARYELIYDARPSLVQRLRHDEFDLNAGCDVPIGAVESAPAQLVTVTQLLESATQAAHTRHRSGAISGIRGRHRGRHKGGGGNGGTMQQGTTKGTYTHTHTHTSTV